MLIHKLNSSVVGALLAISVAATAAIVIWKRHSTAYPSGVKGDRLEVAPQAGCSQALWLYGCDWQFNVLPHERTHSHFGRRGKYQQGLKRLLS